MRCGAVTPRWIRLGDVKWQGRPEPEAQYMIAYGQCTSTFTKSFEGGRCLCIEHAPGDTPFKRWPPVPRPFENKIVVQELNPVRR